MLVRLPEGGPDALRGVLPRDRTLAADDLPLVLRVVEDVEAAHQTVRRLRLVGATVALLEESVTADHSAWCEDHGTELAARTCTGCGRATCAGCALAAGGATLCRRCYDKKQLRSRNTRARQLFVVFLFSVFLLELTRWLSAQAESVDPLGIVRVGIYQFVPAAGLHAPIVRTLNQRANPDAESLRTIARWFSSERERYTGVQGPYLNLEIRGPWVQDVQPPSLGGPDDPWWRIGLRSWRYARYFRDLAEDRGVDTSDVAVRVYLIYGGSDSDLASESRGSERGHVAIAFVALDEENPAYAIATVAHELAHTLGADDLYDETTGLSRYPEGYVEPFANPRFPQRYAELMAVDRPLAVDMEAEIHSLSELRIGYASAAAMGWIGKEQAAWFYDPPVSQAQQALEVASPPTN